MKLSCLNYCHDGAVSSCCLNHLLPSTPGNLELLQPSWLLPRTPTFLLKSHPLITPKLVSTWRCELHSFQLVIYVLKGQIREKTVMVTLLASGGHNVAILPQNAILIPPLAPFCAFPRTTSLSHRFSPAHRAGRTPLPSLPSLHLPPRPGPEHAH